MKYIDMTPTWEELLPTWQFLVSSVIAKRHGEPASTMENFWTEMEKMARAADKWNAAVKSGQIKEPAA